MTQRSLFDASTTQPVACPVPACGAIRMPGQDKAPTCRYDLEREGRRPRGCANVYRPEHAEIPF